MATLKYRKSRKNKKQLKKKKRTYKKRKTTRRKKGGTYEIEPTDYVDDFKYTDFDKSPIKLDDIKDAFIKSDATNRQLYLLEKIVADDNKKSCGINYERIGLQRIGLQNSDTFVECQRQKVDAYCTILQKVLHILKTKPHHVDKPRFEHYKDQLEDKIITHKESTRVGLITEDDEVDLDWTCGMVKPQQP